MNRRLVAALLVCSGAAGCGADSDQLGVRPEVELKQAHQELRSSTLVVPGSNFFPESIAIRPDTTLYTSSINTGEIVKYAPGSSTAQTFVPAGVNLGTAGIAVDVFRRTLWACAVDLTFSTPTQLRAFDLDTGALTAQYTVPDGGVCADIAIAGREIYITDTLVPRIFRVRWPLGSGTSTAGGTLELWSADPLFSSGAGFLQINGIAFDGTDTFYTTNYSSGTLVKVRRRANGTAAPASLVNIGTPFTNPDGIRMLDSNTLLVTENPGPLSKVNVLTGARTLIENLDQPTSVVPYGDRIAWVSEGQVLRSQQGIPPNLPFKLQRVILP